MTSVSVSPIIKPNPQDSSGFQNIFGTDNQHPLFSNHHYGNTHETIGFKKSFISDFTFQASSPKNRSFQRKRARQHLLDVSNRLKELENSYPEMITPGEILGQLTNLDLEDKISELIKKQNGKYFLHAQLTNLKQSFLAALWAHDVGIYDFYILDNGFVALQTGEIGIIKCKRYHIEFYPIFSKKISKTPSIIIPHANSGTNFLNDLPKNFQCQVYYNDQNYHLFLNDGNHFLYAQNGQEHYCFVGKKNKLSIKPYPQTLQDQSFIETSIEGEFIFIDGKNRYKSFLAKKDNKQYFVVPQIGGIYNSKSKKWHYLKKNEAWMGSNSSHGEFLIKNGKYYFSSQEENIFIDSQNNIFFAIQNGKDVQLIPGDSFKITHSDPLSVIIEVTTKKSKIHILVPIGQNKSISSYMRNDFLDDWDYLLIEDEFIPKEQIVFEEDEDDFLIYRIPAEKYSTINRLVLINLNGKILQIDTSKLSHSKNLITEKEVSIDFTRHIIKTFSDSSNVVIYRKKGAATGFYSDTLIIDWNCSTDVKIKVAENHVSEFFYKEEMKSYNEVPYFLDEDGIYIHKTIEYRGHAFKVMESFHHNGSEYILGALTEKSHTNENWMTHLFIKTDSGKFEMVTQESFIYADNYKFYIKDGLVWDLSMQTNIHSFSHLCLSALGSGKTIHPKRLMSFTRDRSGRIRPSYNSEITTLFPEIKNPFIKWSYWNADFALNLLNDSNVEIQKITLVSNDPKSSKAFRPLKFDTNYSFEYSNMSYIVNDSKQKQLQYNIPHEEDPKIILSKQNGYYIPTKEDLEAFHLYLYKILTPADMTRILEISFYPAPSSNGVKGYYYLGLKKMSIYAIKAKNQHEWLQKILQIIIHEISGHGRQNQADQELNIMKLSSLLDSASMQYGELHLWEYNAVMAQFIFLRPELVFRFVYGMAQFYDQLKRDNEKLEIDSAFLDWTDI